MAVRDGLRRIGIPGLQAALVALDPATGNLLAVVGGSDFAATPFNRAIRSKRQPGSAFKPFVYAVALERGMSPVSTVAGLLDVAVQAPEGVWLPRDGSAATDDTLTLREALIESNNAAAVRLMQQVGSARVVKLAGDLGVRDQPDVPSLALGSGLVTPLDLTSAYTAFPTLGVRAQPRTIVLRRGCRGPDGSSCRCPALARPVRAVRLSDGDDAAGRCDAWYRIRHSDLRSSRRRWRKDRDHERISRRLVRWLLVVSRRRSMGGIRPAEDDSSGRDRRANGATDLGGVHATHGSTSARQAVRAARQPAWARTVSNLLSASGGGVSDLHRVSQGR